MNVVECQIRCLQQTESGSASNPHDSNLVHFQSSVDPTLMECNFSSKFYFEIMSENAAEMTVCLLHINHDSSYSNTKLWRMSNT